MPLTTPEIPKLTHDELAEHIRLSEVNAGEYLGLKQALQDELASRDPTVDYSCPKCSHTGFETHQVRTTSGFFSSFFGVETTKFRVIVCARCKYSEFYQGYTSAGAQALDFMLGR